MRSLADLQRAPDALTAPPGLTLPVLATRTFDTPEFRGMTFLEVETKSVLNKVSGMPFGWSINLYRGCQHACSYCLVPDTPILMADGTQKALGDLATGDVVYGTKLRGRYRSFVPSRVSDVWRSVKPAHRITLADGTALVASGDHRFLTERGWKHVTGAEQGAARRPHLTTNNRLYGPGQLPTGPAQDESYRRGYLCGMVRGDGTWGTYRYERGGRTTEVHRFRLALVDDEPLVRTARYLEGFGVPTDRFRFAAATATRKEVQAIRTSRRASVARIEELIRWPVHEADEEWMRGFLAGIFDAEGSHAGTVMRISNADEDILAWTCRCMTALGVEHVREPARENGVSCVRVRGGLPMRLRFLLTTAPATTRKRQIDGLAVKGWNRTDVVAIEPLGVDLPMVDISTETGDFIANGIVSHNCFARPTHEYLNLNATTDFDTTVVVKVNAVEVLRRELAKPSWKGEHVAIGTNVDAYQRAEGRYQLMRGVIPALARSLTPFSILTKGTLITRDVDLLVAASERVPVAASLTIGMLDEAVWRAVEPGTPSPRARLSAVRALNEAGIPTGVMLAPIMPGLNDGLDDLRRLTEAAVEAGATHVTPITLHLRPGVKEAFWPWLESTHPDLVGRYAELYGAPGGRRRGRSTLPPDVAAPLTATVRRARDAAWRRRGGPPDPGHWPDRTRPGENDTGHHVRAGGGRAPESEQLRLL
ncbi:radical SAM protein [Euzebya sp.]|uniref:radical SAM protein n=1 Tax=Euzebya sp. TaxID=1971409 RepID=UPI003515E2A0